MSFKTGVAIKKRKKVTRKPNITKAITVLDPEVELERLPDLPIPEATDGSPFSRKGYAECINNIGYEDVLMQGKAYKVEEVNHNELLILNEEGDAREYSMELFKSIDHGPFREKDYALALGFNDDCKVIKGSYSEGYMDSYGVVIEANDNYAIVQWGSNTQIKFPNINLKLYKRSKMLPPNPFKKGETVKCIKYAEGISLGFLYQVELSEDDFVYMHDHKYYHNHFVSHKKEPKKEKVKKTKVEDKIRYVMNKHSYEKLTPFKVISYLKKEYESEKDFCIDEKEINKVVNFMFRW